MNPITSLIRAIGYFFLGRLRFDSQRTGAEFTAANGQGFRAFRYVILHPQSGQAQKPGAIFIPHFHVKQMSVRTNILFSLIPMWFIIGLPGFRSKYWLVDEDTGDFCGYYEWESIEAAQMYSTSFAMRFMANRSVPGSVWFEIYPADQAPPTPHNS